MGFFSRKTPPTPPATPPPAAADPPSADAKANPVPSPGASTASGKINPSASKSLAQTVVTTPTGPAPTPLDDFFSFCKKVGAKEFETIIKVGQLMQCGPETIIYLQGESSDSFYVINDGMVEIVVADDQGEHPIPITYLSKGDLFGEIGLLTEVPRTASVRVPEAATLLRFDLTAFNRLITTVPAFGHYLAMLLARRLHKTTMQLHFYSNARELAGSLDFFDLPTIFQTISLSQQHGVMHIFNLTSEIMGEFAFADGNPISARYQHLYGTEALLQIFQVVPKANFGFTRANEVPVVESPLNLGNVNDFTMHAVHLRDEMLVIEEKLKISEEKPIKRVHSRLEWSGGELETCAQELWQILTKGPQPLKMISATLPYCRYHILKVIDSLFDSGQLAYAEITPYGYR